MRYTPPPARPATTALQSRAAAPGLCRPLFQRSTAHLLVHHSLAPVVAAPTRQALRSRPLLGHAAALAAAAAAGCTALAMGALVSLPGETEVVYGFEHDTEELEHARPIQGEDAYSRSTLHFNSQARTGGRGAGAGEREAGVIVGGPMGTMETGWWAAWRIVRCACHAGATCPPAPALTQAWSERRTQSRRAESAHAWPGETAEGQGRGGARLWHAWARFPWVPCTHTHTHMACKLTEVARPAGTHQGGQSCSLRWWWPFIEHHAIGC